MQFGPFNKDLSPRLLIKDLTIGINEKNTHLWGKNGVGKSVLLNLILEQIISKKLSFGYVDQNYRRSWLWWKTTFENLNLVLNAKNDIEFYQIPEIKKEISWLKPLLEETNKQVQFNSENEFNTVGLSGGQIQRLVLFREILNKPKFLLLDEAFSALDKKISLELIEWLGVKQKEYNFQIISIVHDIVLMEKMGGLVYELSHGEGNTLIYKTYEI